MKTRAHRRFLVVFALACVLAVLPFAVLKTRSVEIEADLRLAKLWLVTAEDTAEVLDGVKLESLTLQGFDDLHLGPGVFRPIGVRTAPGMRHAEAEILTRDAFTSLTLEEVILNGLEVEAGTEMFFAWDEGAPEYLTVGFAGDDARGSVTIGSELALRCDYCRPSPWPFRETAASQRFLFSGERRREIHFTPRAPFTTLTLESTPGAALSRDGFAVRALKVHELHHGRAVSTLCGAGRVVLPGLDGEEIAVEAGDLVRIEGLEDGRVRSFELDGGLHIQLHGRVSRFHAGPPGFVEDYKPSLLSWLRSSEARTGFLSAVMALAGLAWMVLRKLKLVAAEE